MFKRLQAKWKVNGLNLFLILATFALGGSLCGWAGRKLLTFTGLDSGPLWVTLYILLVTLLWPVSVLLISLFTGQYRFFKNYISRIINKLRKNKSV